jgi:hypothetical protein
MNPIPLLCALLAVSACGADATGREAPTAPDTLVVSTDAELAALASEMLPGLAERSGLTLRTPVRLERRSRAELERYLRAKLDEELPEDRARHLTRVYATLGLMDPEVELRDLLISVYQEQVAGFYDPDSTALFVMDDQSAEALEPILLHELVHAVQDQWADLDAATDPARGNDRATAAQAAIEGHATLVMMEYMTEQLQGRSVDLTEVPGFAGQMRAVLETARDQYPELARAPRIIQEGMLFPYLEGAGFVLEVWRERGNREGALQELLPASTEQVLDPSRFLSDPRDDPATITLAPDAGEVLYADGLGQLEVRILLEEMVGPEAGSAAVGWDGDRYALIRDPSGLESLVWVSVWDDAVSRDWFVGTLTPALERFPVPVSLEARDVAGRAAAVFRAGDGGGASIEIAGGA